jgi:hypothetical protein
MVGVMPLPAGLQSLIPLTLKSAYVLQRLAAMQLRVGDSACKLLAVRAFGGTSLK